MSRNESDPDTVTPPAPEPSPEPASDADGPVPRFVPDPERAGRLLALRVLLTSMIAVGFAAVAFVFVSAFLSDDGEEGNVPVLRVVVGDMAPGETRTLTWEGRPVLVRRRTVGEIERLRGDEQALRLRLRDPDSAVSTQPAADRKSTRLNSSHT